MADESRWDQPGDYSRDKEGKIVPYMMANWPRYVRDNPDDMGAQMLGLALEEIDRLCKKGVKEGSWAARLLWSNVLTWHKLKRLGLGWLIVPVQSADEGKKPQSFAQALGSIGVLNDWRDAHPDRDEP